MKAVPPADDAGRKRRRLDSSASWPLVVPRKDPGDDCVENRPEDGDGTGEGVAGECPGYGVTSVCCRRREMEDAVSVRPDFVRGDHRYHFFGVYVGHGCSHVAESCRNRMHEVVAEEISTSRPGLDRERCAIMERSFALMEAAGRPGDPPPAPTCRCELQTPRCDHVGSTAVVAVVGPDRIVVASCGDSRAVLSHDGAPVPLSTDHKPDRPDELWRIEAAGGRVIYWDGARVLGVLATSRAIGDNHLKPYVISEPEVTVRKRKEGDECLLLASDGLWAVRRQADVPVE
ncbi:phosphatase 2C [Musa troglodytarum]|uniref:protein-serine/threonine phosphatase n=2 Tax=Musa troglodytarum TaxID=320322 RepID=A0A9E7L9J3_9LILI|nr:phosphatase 2C [Musa troglodytarum]